MKAFKTAIAASAMLGVACVGMSQAQAADVEVIHWWTSGGEHAAVSVLAKEFDALGKDKWVDSAIAGGEQARATVMQRILGGDPPDAAQFNNSRQFEELVQQGLLLDLTDLAKKEGWKDFIRPASVLKPCEKDGHIYCVPVNIHSTQWLWTNKSVYKKAGVPEPTTWKELIDEGPAIRKAGFIPLALGGQGWQEDLTFDAVFLGEAGKDLWKKVYADRDIDAASGPDMLQVFKTFGDLRPLVDEGSPGRNWNDATNLVITGKAAAQVMGDWARGEFVLAGKKAEKDYGCIPGPAHRPLLTLAGDVFIFPKQDDPDVTRAQLKLASMLLNPKVQAKFNTAKGSLPVRGDVDMSLADACMKKGLKLLSDPQSVVTPRNVYVSADTDGRIQDVVSQYWNTPSMTAKEAQAKFVDILKSASN